MARKRGGLAGLYDKSKGFLKVAAPVGLSFIPGVGIPLAAAAGAALGADTEGRKYFDRRNIGGAIRGGLEGATLATGTQGARALLTGGGPLAGAVPKMTGGGMPGLPKPSMSVGITPGSGGITKAITAPISGGGGGGGMNAARSLLTGGRNFMRENKDIIEMVGKYTMPPRESEIDRMKAETDRRQQEAQQKYMEFQMQQTLDQQRRDEDKQRRIAEYLMPYVRQNYGQYFGGQ